MENYKAADSRYDTMTYRRCGKSGILLPAISLGLWHNFGSVDVFNNFIQIAYTAFDNGITHFDLANNYGPAYGSAEENFGQISLKRMGIDYVDIFYSHRPDPETPIEETMCALADMVHQGKALYVGISNYNAEQTRTAISVLKEMKVPCLIHQARYSMFDKWVEPELLQLLDENGVGMIAFSPLAQGLLTNKYLHGIPENSRAAKSTGHLRSDQVTEDKIAKIKLLNDLAEQRGQTLAEMALAWLLKDNRVTSVIIGASSVTQLKDNLKALDNAEFTPDELCEIENILK